MNNNDIGSYDELRNLNARIQNNKMQTKENIRGRETIGKAKKVKKKYRLTHSGKVLLYNTIGAAIITSTILMGTAFSQAKSDLIRQRGGKVTTDRAGFSSVVGVEEPTILEVIEFMLEGGKGKGR